jgi:hypothetical protein
MPCAIRPQTRSLARISRCTHAALLMAALCSATACGPDVLPAFANPPPEDAGARHMDAALDAALDDAGDAAGDSGPP